MIKLPMIVGELASRQPEVCVAGTSLTYVEEHLGFVDHMPKAMPQ